MKAGAHYLPHGEVLREAKPRTRAKPQRHPSASALLFPAAALGLLPVGRVVAGALHGAPFRAGLLDRFRLVAVEEDDDALIGREIRRIGASETILLPPQQEYFLRENLSLRLHSARLALLLQDQGAYQADIAAAEKMLSQYFNKRDEGVKLALHELKRLGNLRIAVKAPDIQTSLTALETMKGR